MRRRKRKADTQPIQVLGLIRATIGVGLVVAPGLSTRIWMGEPSASAIGAMRSLGAREIALGVGTLTAVQTGAPVRGWLEAGVLSDAADALNALLFFNGSGLARRAAWFVGAGAAALYGAKLVADLSD